MLVYWTIHNNATSSALCGLLRASQRLGYIRVGASRVTKKMFKHTEKRPHLLDVSCTVLPRKSQPWQQLVAMVDWLPKCFHVIFFCLGFFDGCFSLLVVSALSWRSGVLVLGEALAFSNCSRRWVASLCTFLLNFGWLTKHSASWRVSSMS